MSCSTSFLLLRYEENEKSAENKEILILFTKLHFLFKKSEIDLTDFQHFPVVWIDPCSIIFFLILSVL